jgi:hypothetical protein
VNVPRSTLGKSALGLMLAGQAVMVGGIWVWTRNLAGIEWASRALILWLASGGAGLYFVGRVLQALARRRARKEET